MKPIFNGERYVPEIGGAIHAEHLHRYRLAVALGSHKDVLDIACGEGYGSDLLAQLNSAVVGVDISADTVECAQQTYLRDNLRFVRGDCADLKFEDASFDLVVSFETIEHHARHNEMLREIRRVLRPGGVLMISSPNRPEFDLTQTEPNPFHVKELDFEEFAVLLRSYFPNVAFYAQRVLTGSCIAPLNASADGFRHFDKAGEGSAEIPRPIYFVALACDGALPTLGASVYEVPQLALPSQAVEIVEARLYISEVVDDIPQPYSESRGAAVLYPVSSQRQTIRLPLPADLRPLSRMRLDPANRPAALLCHRLALLLADGTVVWQWDGDRTLFKGIGGLAIRDAVDGLLLLSLNNDPQFDLRLPPEVLVKLPAGACLLVELTPRPLLQVLSDVLRQDDMLGAKLRADVVNRAIDSTSAVADVTLPTLQLSKDLEDIAALLNNSLTRRDEMIARQSTQIIAMREELLRAEAQLDLLQDLMLNRLDSGGI